MARPPISARGRFRSGLVTGFTVIGLVAGIEIVHTLAMLDDLMPGLSDRGLFVVAAAGPALAAGITAGVLLGAALAAVHLAARGALRIAGIERRPLRIAGVEGALLAMLSIGFLVAACRAFDPQVRRIVNAAVMLLKHRVRALETVFFDAPLPVVHVAAAGLVPAVAVFGIWWWTAAGDAAASTPDARPPSRWRRAAGWVLALGAAAAGIRLQLLTSAHYVNQYRDLHLAGLAGAAAAFGGALRLLPSHARLAIESRLAGRKSRVGIAIAAAGLLGSAHFVLEHRLAVEATLLWRTDLARKLVFVLRGLADRDGDGYAAVLGGDDEDDADPGRGPWWWGGSGATRGDGGSSMPLASVDGRFTLPEAMDHVALVSIDALRTDVAGFLGAREGHTPALDRFASRCVRFQQAYAPGSLTHVTYPAILAGRHPVGPPPPGVAAEPFPAILRRHGIMTSGIFCAFFRGDGGFEHADFSIPHDAETPSRRSVELVTRELARNADRSMLWVHFIDPHEPYVDRAGFGAGASARLRYLSEIEAADQDAATLIGTILERAGTKTAVCVFADHGEEFGEHGSSYHGITAYDDLIRVPLLLHVPGIPPRDVRGPVSLIHLAATVLDLMHVPAPPAFHARSLLPVARADPDATPPGPVLSVNNDDMVAYIDASGRWKLLYETRCAFLEVYDLDSDPRERRNLADERPDQRERLKSEAVAFRRSL